ncbi:MAG: hypothetical protein ACRDQA_23585, partial [Nocardioidaceae bacterium]
MRLLFADSTPQATTKALESEGHECVVEPDLRTDDLPARISGFDALVVRSTRVTADVVGAADRLSLIVRAGAG